VTHRRVLGVVIAALVAAVATPVVSVTTASPANAAAYRYWSYWSVSNDAWTFAQRGPTGSRPSDGDVEGWRFSVSPDSRSAPPPRLAAAETFESVCGSTSAQSGKDRVALILDFGIAAHTRPGDQLPASPLRSECVLIDPGTTGWSILVITGVPIRTDDSGMVCGFAGYPSSGCGERVAEPAKPVPTKPSKPTGSGGSGGGASDKTDAPGGSDGSGSGSTGARTPRPGSSTATGARGTTRPSVTATASSTSSRSAGTSSPTATAGPALGGGDAEPTPTLAQGLAASTDAEPASGGPLPALLGVLVLVAVAVAAFVRTRRFGRGGTAP
jgi:hypothetical protein